MLTIDKQKAFGLKSEPRATGTPFRRRKEKIKKRLLKKQQEEAGMLDRANDYTSKGPGIETRFCTFTSSNRQLMGTRRGR